MHKYPSFFVLSTSFSSLLNKGGGNHLLKHILIWWLGKIFKKKQVCVCFSLRFLFF